MIAKDARPQLARKARLKLDRHSGEHWLIYPERGLRLNASAARIAALCQGELQVSEIVERLAAETSADNRDRIEQDVQTFLASLSERGLLSWIT
jgi:pyrroloquinoline quinone biosynthesis protein D